MKKILAIVAILALVSSCAFATAVKKKFCGLDFTQIITTMRSDVTYVNARYDYFVALAKEGNPQAKAWLVAADGFLGQATPLLVGLQQGVCYAWDMIENAINTAKAAKTAEVVHQGQVALAEGGLK